ncbi:TIGR01777 family protein [Acidobacteria bacterium AB60]|nr:TIGR01777 family protein [Acidobacteria bacterium AB60]
MLSSRPLRIVIPGGSGHVGTLLAHYFQRLGHHVTVLTRSPYAASWNTVHWDGEHTGPWIEHLDGADVCINLAGRSVNCRYTRTHREEIYRSRIETTQLLGDVIGGLADAPRVWLNASTATIYRHAPDRPMDEYTGELGGNEVVSPWRRAPESWNFSVRVAKDWEAAFAAALAPRTRKVALRSAIVMSPETGGAFSLLLNLVRWSLGGTQGNGRQFVSWIHGLDFARAVEFVIAQQDFEGPVNLAAPEPVPNRAFMATLRESWGMPNGIAAPAPLLELAAFLLRTESELVLKSRNVIPARLLRAGFEFQFPTWGEAAADLVRQFRQRI